MNTVSFKRALACGLVVSLCAMAGCRSIGGSCNKPSAYAEAQTVPPLKIPPGLQAPDTGQALRVPDLNEPAPPPRKKDDPCLDAPPPYSIPKPAPEPAA